MFDASPVLAVAPELLREAAGERGWEAVLGRIALAPTDANVRAFRRRAARLGIPVGHLRWRAGLDGVPAEALRAAADGAGSRREVLERLGLQPGGRTYAELERACNNHGVELPPRRSHRTSTPRYCTDDQVRAAFAESRSMADLL